MKLIEREDYIKRLLAVLGTPDIKVITGIRRSGKSKLLESFIEKVKASDEKANIVHINFNLATFEGIMEYHALEEFVRKSYRQGYSNIVCIDEVQMCKGFEKAINSLHASEIFDIYVTGSNAFLLSRDLATLFTGRTYEIEVFPFSFSEYCKYFDLHDTYKSFDAFVLEGGMSGSYLYRNQEDKFKYIRNVFSTLVLRDISQKYNLKNKAILDNLCDFMLDNTSNLTSVRNIADNLIVKKIMTNNKTIGNYIKYLCDSFVFYKVRKYDIKGKKYLASQDKYYLADYSFKYAQLGTRNMDYGRAYENIVAVELLRRGYEVYVGALYKKEIDFIAIKQNEKLYIQVADDISSPDTFDRETASLLNIKDAYPKLILAHTRHDEYQYEGIHIIDIADWLANKLSKVIM